METTFDNSVSVLVMAYLNDTLERGRCAACAVGNLIQGYRGYKFSDDEKSNLESHARGWVKVFVTMANACQHLSPLQYKGEAKEQIDSTGYTWEQLARVENAFERAPRGKDAMFNGLIAVVDVLADIHGVDLTIKENAITQFETIHATK